MTQAKKPKPSIPEWAKPENGVIVIRRVGVHFKSPHAAKFETIRAVTRAGWISLGAGYAESFKIGPDGTSATQAYRRGSMYASKSLYPDTPENRQRFAAEISTQHDIDSRLKRYAESERQKRDEREALARRRVDALARILREVSALDESQREAVIWAIGTIKADDE